MASKLFILALATCITAPAGAETATATLPLDELLVLHDSAESEKKEPEAPPVRYSVTSFDARARIIGDAIEATAAVRLSVFEKGWVRVPILEEDPTLDLTKLPTVANGNFVSTGGGLSFITEKPGSYNFEIEFLKRASKIRSGWEVVLKPADSAIRRVHLNHDDGLFEVSSATARREGDGLIVFARNGELKLSWKSLRPVVATRKRDRKRTPIEPVVTSATASVVVTLDGQRITRSLYKLRFQGEQTLAVSLPEGHQLAKVYLNGISRPFELSNGRANISVTPPRPGDQTAVVEVVLRRQTPPLALSGTLSFELPTVSWRINEMQCALFLPNVFNYSWVGGSLSPGTIGELPTYTFDVPTPGKQISVTQQLVNGSPDTVVEYTVDLAQNYFQ